MRGSWARSMGLAIALTTALTACGADPGSDIDAAAVATTYADLVAAAYQASIDSAATMQVAIEAFLSDPTDENLAAAKAAWVAARDDYTPTEAFRFYDGPIDNPEDGPEGQINAWPLDEAYIDYVNDAPEAGIINDLDRISAITAEVLVEANEAGGETNISTGWHAIEFLLWGQDLDAERARGAPVDRLHHRGQRRSPWDVSPARDRVAGHGPASPCKRSGTERGAYRAEFLGAPDCGHRKDPARHRGSERRRTGGRANGGRLRDPDQEDEHSCFSDNTNADVVGDCEGIQMVYLRDFPGIDGPACRTSSRQPTPNWTTPCVTKSQPASNFRGRLLQPSTG